MKKATTKPTTPPESSIPGPDPKAKAGGSWSCTVQSQQDEKVHVLKQVLGDIAVSSPASARFVISALVDHLGMRSWLKRADGALEEVWSAAFKMEAPAGADDARSRQ